MPSTRRSGRGHSPNPPLPGSEMASEWGGGFGALKLMSWFNFSQGKKWLWGIYPQGLVLPLVTTVLVHRKDLC